MPLVKNVLELALYNAAYNAAKSGFKNATAGFSSEYDKGEQDQFAEKVALKFAQSFSKSAATAIDAYIKSATIMGGVVTTAGSPTAQTGSVVGPLSIT